MAVAHRRFLAFIAAAFAFALAIGPSLAHQAASTEPVFVSTTPVVATGTVTELVVRTQSGTELRYFAIKVDRGETYALTGPGLETLSNGLRINATGVVAGKVFQTYFFGVEPQAPSATPKALLRQSVTGTLAVYHKDFFEQGRGEFGLAVRDATNALTFLDTVIIPDSLEIGMQVTVDGALALDRRSLAAETIFILAAAPLNPNDVAAAPITNTVLVIPIRFSTGAAGSANGAAINTEFQTRVAPYYNEVSFGQQLLNVTVACTTTVLPGCAGKTDANGWLQSASPMPPPTASGCDFTTMGNLANAVAQAAGYDTSVTSTKFVYYLIPNAGCGWAGLAYVGYGHAWSQDANALWVYGHELGHNFGLWHAGSVGCGANVIGGSCGVSEYGDPFNIMGNIRQMHFNALQKRSLGWIPSTSVKTHSSGTQTYQLSPIETGGKSTYAVKVPTSLANRTYWIEFRQPIGFDLPLSSLPNLGAQIRVGSPFETTSGNDDTEILDMTPGSGSGFDDAALLATAPPFIDNTTGVTISVNSATAGASGLLTVTVAMGGKTTSTTALVSSANPSTSGSSVTFTATVTGTAPTGSVAFTSDTVAISGCSAVALPAGAAASKAVPCSTSALTTGTHNIVAAYSGDAANAASSSPSLSQGVSASNQINVALASNGGIATASSTYGAGYPSAAINNNERAGANWGNGGGWADGTSNAYPDWVEIDFNGSKTIDRVVVYTVQDNYSSPVEPTDSMTFSQYGLTDFTVQGWNGSAWVTLGSVAGNNLVKRTVNFPATTTDRIRINATNALYSYSRIAEVEAWGINAGPAQINVALASNGGIATASSTYTAGYPAATLNNNERAGANWGSGGGWADGTGNAYPDWVEIDFNGSKTIGHVVVYTVQDNYSSPVEPTDTMTFSQYGITDFTVQGWNGSAWFTLGSVAGNNLVKRTVNFPATTTDRIRISVTNALYSYSRITEVEAWGN